MANQCENYPITVLIEKLDSFKKANCIPKSTRILIDREIENQSTQAERRRRFFIKDINGEILS